MSSKRKLDSNELSEESASLDREQKACESLCQKTFLPKRALLSRGDWLSIWKRDPLRSLIIQTNSGSGSSPKKGEGEMSTHAFLL